ncbi:hypothetical protein [Ktedonobacter racemifer]|uniref:hypothetical protein n=1 Tax=Ktedonobacter racemifer TaxID=363277 RepID=UPI00059008A0|nr:hypothetical protein [Ktedonobacter racemifer]
MPIPPLRHSMEYLLLPLFMPLGDSHGVIRPTQERRSPGSAGLGEEQMERTGPECTAHVLDEVEPG